jgi:hypothetical protein
VLQKAEPQKSQLVSSSLQSSLTNFGKSVFVQPNNLLPDARFSLASFPGAGARTTLSGKPNQPKNAGRTYYGNHILRNLGSQGFFFIIIFSS